MALRGAQPRWLVILLLTAALFPIVAVAATRSGPSSAYRVPMSSIKTLYFKDGATTLARRGKNRPQLKCVGNSKHLCETYSPDIFMCKSAGDGAWRCEADLHQSVRLGAVEVSCEGWDSPDDEYVLRGSCLLEYNILPAYKHDDGFLPGTRNLNKDGIASTLFFLTFFGILGYIVFSFFRSLGQQNNGQPRPAGNRAWGGWGGGFGPGWGPGHGHDAPPPYQPYPKPGDTASNGWRPGFWTGLGMGGLAAQAARTLFSQPSSRGPHHGAPPPAFRSAAPFANRAFGQGFDDDNNFDDSLFTRRRNAASSSAGPSETRRSTGFGGTRNR